MDYFYFLLRWLNTTGFRQARQHLCLCLRSCNPSYFWKKGVYSKRKEFAPRGSKFFPLRIDPLSRVNPLSRRETKQFHRVTSHELYPFTLKWLLYFHLFSLYLAAGTILRQHWNHKFLQFIPEFPNEMPTPIFKSKLKRKILPPRSKRHALSPANCRL